uniref:Small EDRK-rich factor-like N-terminal domain-containing protein n=1 Tax=Canis lupus dingo TaxID=286419 RepID=A0A8C0L9U9_CANLU
MTHGNQCELACQKNMKKQSDLVKGKRRDDGLSAAPRKQSAPSSLPPGTRRSCKRHEPRHRLGSVGAGVRRGGGHSRLCQHDRSR